MKDVIWEITLVLWNTTILVRQCDNTVMKRHVEAWVK